MEISFCHDCVGGVGRTLEELNLAGLPLALLALVLVVAADYRRPRFFPAWWHGIVVCGLLFQGTSAGGSVLCVFGLNGASIAAGAFMVPIQGIALLSWFFVKSRVQVAHNPLPRVVP